MEKEKKIYVRMGYITMCITQKEYDLLWYLYTRNLLKFVPEKVEVYGSEE